MEFTVGEFYHIYNRGNDRSRTFFNDENYLFFLRKIRKELLCYCDIVAYCLMPNHYHLLVYTKQETNISSIPPALESNSASTIMHPLSRKIGTLQSSYTQAINIEQKRRGSLFQQKAKAKQLENYAFECFHYIHQNPVKAGLCKKFEDWPYSSFRDYYKVRNGSLPNLQIAYDLLEIEEAPERFYEQSKAVLRNKIIIELYQM